MPTPTIPLPQTEFLNPQTKLIDEVWWRYLRSPVFASLSTGVALGVDSGGTGLSSGVSGGIPAFVSSTVMSSSALLTQYAIVLGGGAGAAPSSLTTTGTSTQVLHGNSSNPYFGSVVLTSDVSGLLPIANGGTSASTAATARDALGLSSMAQQSSSNVNIVGGAINVATLTTFTNMQVGTSATAGFNVFASSVSWKNNPTHSSSHIFQGWVRANTSVTTAPPATNSAVTIWITGNLPIVSLVNSTMAANSRHVYSAYDGSGYRFGFLDDAFSVALDAFQLIGNNTVISSVALLSTTVRWMNPSHNSSHTFLSTVNFSGALNANGSARLGSSATFGLQVNATTVGWNNPTHNSSHTFASTVTFNGLTAGNVSSGVYTPTLSSIANLDGATTYQAQFIRIGPTVNVSGKVDVDPTLTTTLTRLGISLPIASNIGAEEDAAGTAFASGIAAQGAAIRGNATDDTAEMAWISGDVTVQPMYYVFSYQVI